MTGQYHFYQLEQPDICIFKREIRCLMTDDTHALVLFLSLPIVRRLSDFVVYQAQLDGIVKRATSRESLSLED